MRAPPKTQFDTQQRRQMSRAMRITFNEAVDAAGLAVLKTRPLEPGPYTDSWYHAWAAGYHRAILDAGKRVAALRKAKRS